MGRTLFPRIVPFLAIVIFILLNFPASLCALNEQYERCGRDTKCGNITITYPFFTTWGRANRPYYCGSGYSTLGLHCRDDQILIMNMEKITYRVLTIDDSTHTVTIAPNDYWDAYCPTSSLITDIDSQYFHYSSVSSSIDMYYGCPSNITGYANQQFTCVENRTNTTLGYYYVTDYGHDFMSACNVSVSILVQASALETLKASPSQENVIAAIHGGFDLVWDANNGLCSACVESGGQCGRNISLDEFSCYCQDMAYPFICRILGPSSSPNITGSSSGLNTTGSSSGLNIRLKLAIGISAVVAGSIIIVLELCFLRREGILYKLMIFRRKKTKNDQDLNAFIKNYGSLLSLQQYRYADVKKITKSFIDKLGQGGYRSVYKGKLSDGRLMAVKVLNESKGDGEEFLNEVASISRTSHVNVVTLLGFCYERTKRALIYEFVPNGSLDQFIYLEKSSNTNSQLEWKTLYRIAVGIGRGLEYLHNGCNTRILHFNIKPHNILLDEESLHQNYPICHGFGP